MVFEDIVRDIKGNNWIYANEEYIVITGNKLWILKKGTNSSICRRDISNTYKVTFLPENRLLIGQGRKTSYRLISLEDGSDIWTLPPMKMESSVDHFAISQDLSTSFDCFSWSGKDYLVKIDLQTGNAEKTLLQQGLRTTNDLLCDETGIPCLLQTHYEEIAGNQVSQNGIRSQYMDDLCIGSADHWKYKWQLTTPTISKYFLGSTECVLTNNLYVFEPKTGNMYFLLENEPNWQPPNPRPCGCWISQCKRFITIMYDNMNIVVDYIARKMIARYAGQFARGCIVDNTYWIAAKNGIRQVPFPIIEDVPLW